MTRLWPEGEPIETWGNAADCLDGFHWQGTAHRVASVHNRWRVHTLWWQPQASIWREYVKVTTDSGLLCLLYRDLLQGDWRLARVYD
ncbi:MAG: hypothetical protein PVH17_01680 [Anaerolineae bacterium]